MQFLREWNPGYTTSLVRTRILPLYSLPNCVPYLLAAANWVIGELASSLPEVTHLLQYVSYTFLSSADFVFILHCLLHKSVGGSFGST